MEEKSHKQLLELTDALVKIINGCEILIKERCYEKHKIKFILTLYTLSSKVYQVSSFEELENLCHVLCKLMEWIKKSTKDRIIQMPEDECIQELLRETEQNENIKIIEEEKIYYGIIERIAHNDPLFSLVIMYLTCLLISSDYYFIKIPAGILSWFEGIQSTKKMARGFINNKFIKNEIDELDKSIENIMKKSNREVNRNIDKNELRQLILLQNFDNLKNENIAEQRENDESENIPMQKRDEDVLNLVS